MASRNEVGVRATTRTGPFHGPGMRTRYSSPTCIGPSPPWTLVNLANSVGATIVGDAADDRR